MAKVSGKLRGISALILLVAIGSCFAALPEKKPLTPEEQAAKDSAEKLTMALIRCENKTRDSLADRDGFDPEPLGQWVMLDASEDRHVVSFKARAKNAFGALIWARFECTATYDGEHWTAEVRQMPI